MVKPEDISLHRLESYMREITSNLSYGDKLPENLRARAEAIVDLHTGSDEMIDLLDSIEDLDLLSRYLSKSLPDFDRQDCQAKLVHTIKSRNIPFISLLVRHGIRVTHLTEEMMTAALDAQDADCMAFIRASHEDRYHILKTVSDRYIIDECTRDMAPFIAEELVRATPRDLERYLNVRAKPFTTLKTAAALLCLDLPVGLYSKNIFYPELRPLFDAANDPRTKYRIRGSEPSLQHVLARPVDAVFFGFRELISKGGLRQIVPQT